MNLEQMRPLIEKHGLSHIRAWAVNSPAFFRLSFTSRMSARDRIAGPIDGWLASDQTIITNGVEVADALRRQR